MVDYTKLTAKIEEIGIPRLVSDLDLRQTVNPETGETAVWPLRGTLENLRLTLVPASCGGGAWLQVSGSLHRLSEGGTNFGQFTFSTLSETVEKLVETLKIHPERFAVRQMEAGINASRLPYPTAKILNNALGYAGREFRPIRAGNWEIGLDLCQDETRLKLYAKGVQYSLPFDLLRFEVGALCHAARTFGIASFADLTDRRKMERIGPILGGYAGRIAFDDVFQPGGLTASQGRILALGRNPRSYREFDRKTAYQFRNLVDRRGTLRIARTLETLVRGTWLELLEN